MASNGNDSGKKVLTLAEVKQLAEDKNKCIMIISDHVYDVTKFLDEVSQFQLITNAAGTGRISSIDIFLASGW